MKKLLYISLLALVSCGGSHSDEPAHVTPVTPEVPEVPVDPDMPMSFAPASSAVSRAGTPMQDVYTLFKVWAYKHTSATTTETVMPGYQVKYLDDSFLWQYDGSTYTYPELADQFLKFWDASALSYDFSAYAPVDLGGSATVSFSQTDGFMFSNIPVHSSDDCDLVVAKHVRHVSDADALSDYDALTGAPTDVQPDYFHSVVPLVFHHLLSKVQYRIYNTGNKIAEINNIDLSFDDGEYYYTDGVFKNGSWTSLSRPLQKLMAVNYVEPNQMKVKPIKKEDYQTESTPIIHYYEIPQALGSYVTVTLDVNGEVIKRRFQMSDSQWSFDKNYIYYIHIDVVDGSLNPIFIDLTMAEFLPGEEVDEVVTNW